MTAAPLKEDDTGGDGYVERGDGAGHGDPDDEVAVLADVLVQAAALAAENEDGWFGEVDLVVERVAAFVEAVDPIAGALQFFECLANVSDADDRKILEGAGGSLGYGIGQSGRAAFGNDDSGCAGGVGRADDGPQVVWILHAIQCKQKIATQDVA